MCITHHAFLQSNLIVFSTSNWVLDSNFSTHICTSMQDLIESKRLRQDDMILQIDNRAKITAEIIETFPL